MKVIAMLKNFWLDEGGVTLIEYALLAALIAVVAIASIRSLGSNVNTQLNKIATAIGAT